MALFRRSPLLETRVDIDPVGRVVVAFAPEPGRWPHHEAVDRLVLPAGIAALALSRAGEASFDPVHAALRRFATAIATDPSNGEAEMVHAMTGLDLVDVVEAPASRVVVQLVRSRLGPVPTTGRAGHAPALLATAAGVVLGVSGAAAPSDARLAAALTLEGLLGWYRVADPHLQPPQQAVAYALRHADARMAERGRPSPRPLAVAVAEQRKIEPMAGG